MGGAAALQRVRRVMGKPSSRDRKAGAVKASRDSMRYRPDLDGEFDNRTRRASAGATSPPIRDVDAETRALIDKALAERGMK